MAVNCNQSQLIESVAVRDRDSSRNRARWGGGRRLWGKTDRKTRREREAAEEIKLEKGSGWDWLDAAVRCEITKPLFDGGLNVPCLLRLPVSLTWTHTLRKLFPGVKWIHRGTALGISEGGKMETSIWWRRQLRQTSSTWARPLWLSHEAFMTCSLWMDGRERNLAIYRNPLHLIIINNINNDKDIDTRRNVNPPNLEIKTYLTSAPQLYKEDNSGLMGLWRATLIFF